MHWIYILRCRRYWGRRKLLARRANWWTLLDQRYLLYRSIAQRPRLFWKEAIFQFRYSFLRKIPDSNQGSFSSKVHLFQCYRFLFYVPKSAGSWIVRFKNCNQFEQVFDKYNIPKAPSKFSCMTFWWFVVIKCSFLVVSFRYIMIWNSFLIFHISILIQNTAFSSRGSFYLEGGRGISRQLVSKIAYESRQDTKT